MALEPQPIDLTHAEHRHVVRLIEKAIKACAAEIDTATRGYETRDQQRSMAMTILDGLTLAVVTGYTTNPAEGEVMLGLHAQHCLMRLAQLSKKPIQ